MLLLAHFVLIIGSVVLSQFKTKNKENRRQYNKYLNGGLFASRYYPICVGLYVVEDCSIYVDEAGKNLVSICSYFVLKIVNLIVAVNQL